MRRKEDIGGEHEKKRRYRRRTREECKIQEENMKRIEDFKVKIK